MHIRFFLVLFAIFSLLDPRAVDAVSAEVSAETEAKLAKFTVILQRYEEDLKSDPTNLKLMMALGDAYYSLQVYDKAVEYYSRALKLDPTNNKLKQELAYAYVATKNYRKGSSLFQELYKIDPENPNVIAGLGRIAAFERNPQQAEAYYLRALQIDPNSTQTLFFLGELRAEQKRYDDAAKLFEKALYLDPKATWAEMALKKAKAGPIIDEINKLEDRGDLQAALERYKKELDANPDIIDFYVGLARLYTRMKQYPEATKLLNNAIKQYPKDTQLVRSLGFVYLARGDVNQAQQIFEQLNEQSPNDAETIAGLGRVEAIKGNPIKAEEFYKKAMEADPNDLLTLSFQAQLRLDEKKYAEAEKLYEKIVQMDPRALWAKHALVDIKLAPLLDAIKNAEEWGNYSTAEVLYAKLIAQAPDREEYYIRLAQLYVRQKNYTKAIEIYHKAMDTWNKSADLYLSLANAYMLNGEVVKSQATYAEALKLDPNSADAIAGMGRTYVLMGDDEEGEFWYKLALDIDQKNTLALGYLADLAIEQKRYILAQQLYEKLLKVDPTATWARQSIIQAKYAHDFAKANVMLEAGNIAGAEALYTRILEMAPDSVDAYLGLGQIYMDQGRYKEALDIFKKGLQQVPTEDILRVNVGLANLDLGRLTQAQSDFTKVLVKNPQNPEAIAGMGKISEILGDQDAAEYQYKQALKVDPGNLFVLSTLAQFYLKQGDYADAVEQYDTILKVEPKASWAKQGLERAKNAPALAEIDRRLVVRDYDSAEKMYRELIARNPDDPDYYVKFAQLYMKQKKYQDAIVILQQGQAVAPDSNELRIGLGYAYLKKGDMRLSQNAFEMALTKNPSDAEAMAGLGQLAEAQEKPDEAEVWYKKALLVQPDNISSLAYLAQLKVRQGEYSTAQKYYKRIITVDPLAAWAKTALKDAKYGILIEEIKKKEAAKDFFGTEALFKQLILQAPNVPNYYLRFGQFYHHNKEYGKAIAIYKKGIEITPNNSDLYADLGLVYVSKKSPALAAQAFRKALQLNPNEADALAGLGAVATMRKQYDKADKYLMKSRTLNPDGDADLSALGNLRMLEKRYDEAEDAYKKLMDLEPNEKWIRLLYQNAKYGAEIDRIKALAEAENYSAAAEGYSALIEKAPDNPYYYSGLGLMYLRMKEYSKAIDVYIQGIQESPEEDELLVSLGYAYMFDKQLGLARKTLLEALHKDAKNPETLAGLGQIDAQEDNTYEAEEYFMRALKISPINQSALAFYGNLLMKQKRYKEAKDMFVRLHKILPKAEWLDRVLQDAEDGPLMDLARDYANENELEIAAGLYQQLVWLLPEDPARYQPLGQMYLDMQDYSIALDIFQQGLSIDPKSPYLWRGVAFTYIAMQDYDTASCIFMYLLGEDYNDSESWAGLGRIQALHGSECLATEYYCYALSISPRNITTLGFVSDMLKTQGYYFSGLQYSTVMMDIDPEPKWIRVGYNSFLNLTCPTIKGAGAYHAEDQWDPINHRWSAQYEVYGGSVWINYPLCDELTLWARVADEIYTLKDLEGHFTIYSFDVQRLYLGEKWVISPCSTIDARIGLSNYSPHRYGSFIMQKGWIVEPTIAYTYRTPLQKATIGFYSDADLIARNFNTNRAKLVGRYYFMGTYEQEIYKRTWAGIEASTFWYGDYVGNTSQRISGWLQWRPPFYTDNILFRYYVKYQTFAHNIADYYTYKPQIINQLQMTLQKDWRVCWADRFYTSLSYAHGWQDTHTRYPNIIVIVPAPQLPPFVWDDRQFNTVFGNIIYTRDQLQVTFAADWYRDTQKYTMWTVGAEVTWRF